MGESRIVPDYISLFPQSQQVAPFAGATRNLCDRKEVTLGDQAGAIAKFYIYTSTHIASKFTGIITDDFTVEFDPFAPTFGEKFSPPNMPVSFKDWTGTEISRVYSDQWGVFNGLDLLHLGSESAQPDRVCAQHDDHVHERSGADSRSESIPARRSLIRCSTRTTASSATRTRTCREKRTIWILLSCRHRHLCRRATTIPTAPIPMPRRP